MTRDDSEEGTHVSCDVFLFTEDGLVPGKLLVQLRDVLLHMRLVGFLSEGPA